MKLSTKQQLLKDASSELKRLRKLAGLSESKKPLNEAIAFVKGQRVNVPSRYIMKCHTATPDKYVYGNSMYKVGDFVGTDGKPTKDLQKAQIFDKEDAYMWEDTYTTGEIEKYSKAIPDFNGVYSLGAFFKPVAFKVGGLSESKSKLKLKEVALDGSKISYSELKRLRKLTGLSESKKSFLIEEFVESPDVLIASVNGIFDTMMDNIKRGVRGDGTPLPTTIDKQAALKVIAKHEKVIISKIRSNEISNFDDIVEYIKVKLVDDMRKLGFPE